MIDRKKGILNGVLAIALGGSPVAAKIATEIASNIKPTTINMVDHILSLSRRDFLKIGGLVSAAGLALPLPESVLGNKPDFTAFVTNNPGGANFLAVHDQVRNRLFISVGKVESGQTPTGLPATFFSETTLLVVDWNNLNEPRSFRDVHRGTQTDVLSTYNPKVSTYTSVSIWPDMFVKSPKGSREYVNELKIAQEMLDEKFKKYINNPEYAMEPAEFEGMRGYSGTARLIIVKNMHGETDHSILSFRTPEDREFIAAVRLETLKVQEDPISGWGGEKDIKNVAKRARIMFPAETPEPSQPQLPEELAELFEKLGAELGEDENGNPIYFVTNPAGETVTVGIQNENKEWEATKATQYRVFETLEEAIASGEIVETEDALKGIPGYSAQMRAQPLPEDALTGLNIVVITPNFVNPQKEQLDFDDEGKKLIEKNPDRAPYRLMGYFVFKNIYKDVEQPGHGMVWQWKNPDGSYVYITTIITKFNPAFVYTPFASLNYTKDLRNAPILEEIAYDVKMNELMLEWAETDVVPAKLQDRALIMSYLFP